MKGAKRKHNPTIPAHIDQSRLPVGIYWDSSGNGRWYVFDPNPDDGRPRRNTVAQPGARLSELHAIAEARAGNCARGTLDYVWQQFKESTEFKGLSTGSQKNYRHAAAVVARYPTRLGIPFGQLQITSISTATIQRLVEAIAQGRPESRPGADDSVNGYPSKANHILRYLRRLMGWGIRFDACKTNPAIGVKEVKERGRNTMPVLDAFHAVLAFARAGAERKAHTAGSLAPYLVPLMEITYLCRLRGIEAVTLTDANALPEGVRSNRRKGSLDNVTAWNARLHAAWANAQAVRAKVLKRYDKRPVPLRADQRALFLSEDGTPLSKSGLDSAWGRMIEKAIEAGVITEAQRFTLHGLKHRGVTDTKGTRAEKKDASGHRSDAAFDRYDHELQLVRAANEEGKPA